MKNHICRIAGVAVSLVAMSIPAKAADLHPDHVFWGDEHVHSGWSADAGLSGTTLTPEDAVCTRRSCQIVHRRERPIASRIGLDGLDGPFRRYGHH